MRALTFALTLALTACAPPAETKTETPPATTTAAPMVDNDGASPVEANLAHMPGWDAAREAGVDFRGVGQEPGWMLDIYTRGIIKFVWDYGDHYAEFAAPQPTSPREGATRYEANADGHTLVITTRRFPCQDAMSGEGYPATVEVVIDSRTLNGCGKSV